MEKKTSYTILDEMRQAVSAIRSQLESLEAQMADLEAAVSAQSAEQEALPAEAAEVVAAAAVPAPAPEPVAEPEPAPAPVAEPEPAPEPELEPAPAAPVAVVEEVQDLPEEPAAEAPAAPAPVIEDVPSDTLVMEEAPEPIDLGISDFSIVDIDMPAANINDAEAVNVKPAVMDVMAEKCAWKTDMPGTPVKNVLSAISLNDRILFVNTLFGEDAALFQQTIQIFNTYTTLAEAEAYVRTNFRNWDMNSDVVYRFMMAARRKLK